MNIKELSQKVEQTAPVDPEVRFVGEYRLGMVAHQGDIYIHAVESVDGTETDERQLAPGSTKGSRHILHDFEGRVLMPKTNNPLHGPMIDADERFSVKHPEHAEWSLPAGRYNVTYQRDYEREEIRRVVD